MLRNEIFYVIKDFDENKRYLYEVLEPTRRGLWTRKLDNCSRFETYAAAMKKNLFLARIDKGRIVKVKIEEEIPEEWDEEWDSPIR